MRFGLNLLLLYYSHCSNLFAKFNSNMCTIISCNQVCSSRKMNLFKSSQSFNWMQSGLDIIVVDWREAHSPPLGKQTNQPQGSQLDSHTLFKFKNFVPSLPPRMYLSSVLIISKRALLPTRFRNNVVILSLF